MHLAAIVPMRQHSTRVKGKNFRRFNGRPLYHEIIDTLLSVELINEVVIDTDSTQILDETAQLFPQITPVVRPPHLRRDDLPMNEVLLNTTQQVSADFYLQTHSTNPLLRPETIRAALEFFLDRYPEYDSMFAVTRLQTRLWDTLGRAINHNPNILLRTQDLPPVYEENSCFYLFTQKNLTEKHNRIGNRPLLWEVPKDEAIDIDEEIDFEIAEIMAQKRKTHPKK